MDTRMLNVLEWSKIIELLKHRTSSIMTRDMIDDTKLSNDIQEIKVLQKQTKDAVEVMFKKGNPPFAGLRDILPYALDKAEKGSILSCKELLAVTALLSASRGLKRYYFDESAISTSLDDFFNLIKPIRNLEEEIDKCIIDDDTISDDASPNLRRIRREIVSANGKVKEHLNGIIRSSSQQKFLQDNLVTIRDGRYVIPVKQEYRNEIPGIVHYQSATGSTLFIEPIAVVNENNNLRQLKLEEQEEIERILAYLTSKVAENVDDIKLNLDMSISLDFIFARAKLSVDLDCSEPILNNVGKVNIVKGRHPLIDKKRVVPINIYLGSKFNVLVITGPNTGGKTVTLKTLGIISLMAYYGIQIPASGESEIAVFENIYADIGDEQSIEQSLSTFSAHMSNIIKILNNVNNKSLVLLDEVGSGTDPVEGSALAMAILEFLKKKGSRVLATTHYSQLKTYAITKENVENACCEFDVQTLSPTYRLLIGIPGKSNALAISKRLGLDNNVLELAEGFISEENIKFEDVIADLEYNKRMSEEERQKTAKIRNEVEELKKDLKDKALKIELEKEKVLDKAYDEASRILFEAKQVSEESLKDIRKISKELEDNRKVNDAELAKEKINKKFTKVQEKVYSSITGIGKDKKKAKSFQEGDEVLLVSLNQKGIILELKPDDRALVQAGIMKITVAVSNLEPLEPKKASKGSKQVLNFAANKIKSINARIDIRGTRVEEALEEVDKYLDDVCIAGLKQVTIVHGKGTGALRKAIHDQLRRHPHVKSFRIGEYGEGDSGITVIELR
jgi:DNA mismatch repair protein MutS2